MRPFRSSELSFLALLMLGCSSSSSSAPPADAGAPALADLDMTPADFECVQHWQKVGNYRITNKRGALAEALAVANSADGGVFPVGTVIQLVPYEASVKRAPGFSAASHDWEFFTLQVSDAGTTITKRGSDGVVNAFGGNCLACHSKAAPQWDFVCDTTHGCDPLPIPGAQLATFQTTDPRCP